LAAGTNEHLVAQLERWLDWFGRGHGQFRPLNLRSELATDELLASVVSSVGVIEGDPSVPVPEWEARPGSTGFSGRAEGAAYATNQRAFRADRRIVREWAWGDVFSVRVLPDWTGVVISSHPDAVSVDVIARDRHGAPGTRRLDRRDVAFRFLKFEGVVPSYRGHEDDQVRSLPARLTEGRS